MVVKNCAASARGRPIRCGMAVWENCIRLSLFQPSSLLPHSVPQHGLLTCKQLHFLDSRYKKCLYPVAECSDTTGLVSQPSSRKCCRIGLDLVCVNHCRLSARVPQCKLLLSSSSRINTCNHPSKSQHFLSVRYQEVSQTRT